VRIGTAEVDHFGRTVMAVGSDQDLDPGPVAANRAPQPAEEDPCLGTGRPPRRAQHGSHRAALAVEHHDRLEAILVVAGIEEAPLLPAMDGTKGVVDVERDARRAARRRNGRSEACCRPMAGRAAQSSFDHDGDGVRTRMDLSVAAEFDVCTTACGMSVGSPA
jgi:hypothetical protein